MVPLPDESGDVHRKADPHEEAREGLGEVLSVRRLEPEPARVLLDAGLEELEVDGVDIAEGNDPALAGEALQVAGCEHVEAWDVASSDASGLSVTVYQG